MSSASVGKLSGLLTLILASSSRNTNLFKAISSNLPNSDQHYHTINAETTLPAPLKSKNETFEEVKVKNPEKKGIALKALQVTAFGKGMFKFYKAGLLNVWNNKREMNRLVNKELVISNQVNNKGKSVNLKVPNFSKLVYELTQALYMNKIENEQVKLVTKGDVIKNDKTEVIYDEELFNVSRAQFQLIRRTSEDFIKLPAFAVIVMIFAETTPFLCYAFPQITPLTCVLPSILPRLWDSKSGELIKLIRFDESKMEDWALETAYNLPYKTLLPLTGQLGLRSKYLPGAWYPESYLRNKLHQYYNYLIVDNYYLSGLNGNGNIWDLSDEELVRASLERCLISDVSAFVKELENERAAKLEGLRLKLLRSVVDMDKYNVGYLTVGHLLK